MSGGGSMSSMNTTIKNNRSIRGIRKTMSDRNAENAGDFGKGSEPLVYKNKVTAESRQALQSKLKKKKKKLLWSFIAAVGIVFLFFGWIIYSIK